MYLTLGRLIRISLFQKQELLPKAAILNLQTQIVRFKKNFENIFRDMLDSACKIKLILKSTSGYNE